MSGLKAFLKQNKKDNGTVKVVASNSFIGEDGKPMEWEIRPLKTKEAEHIRSMTMSIGKGGKVNTDTAAFNRSVAAKCTVFPDLNDVELQDSYGVMGAEELIQEMLDKDGDYQKYVKEILKISGFDTTDAQLKEDVKN